MVYLEYIKEFAIELICLSLLLLTMVLLWKYNNTILALFLISSIYFAIYWSDKVDKLLFSIMATLMIFGEIFMVLSGAWTYNNPSFLRVPVWIAYSWGFVSVIIRHMSNTLEAFLIDLKLERRRREIRLTSDILKTRQEIDNEIDKILNKED